MIGKGYYIKARKIQDSEIAHAPPHVREIWDYFLREANHQEVKKYGKTIQRGQLIRTYGDIIEALHWMVGWRKMSYSKSDCETAMKYLKKRAMVLTEKTTRGMVVTVCNYDTYQDPKHYENHKESYSKPTGEPQSDDTINKNGRKKELKKVFIKPTLEEITQYCKERKNAVNPQKWLDHYTSNGWMVGRNPMKDWKSAVRTWETNKFNNGGEMSSEERGAEVARLLAESRG